MHRNVSPVRAAVCKGLFRLFQVEVLAETIHIVEQVLPADLLELFTERGLRCLRPSGRTSKWCSAAREPRAQAA